MQISTYVQDIIGTKQNFEDEAFYTDRAHLSFRDSGPSCIDLVLQLWLSHGKHIHSDSPSDFGNSGQSSPTISLEGLKISDSEELLKGLHSGCSSSKFFFIRQKNSRSRLDVDRELFELLCKSCSIFDKIRSYILCFGIRGGDIHINPPALRFSLIPEQQNLSLRGPYTGYEVAYVLRSVEPNNRADGIPWSIRQSGIYQQFKGYEEPQTWLFIALPSILESQLKLYLSNLVEPQRSDASELHFVLFDAAISSWRGCILFFAELIQKQSDLVFMAQIEVDDFTVVHLDGRQYVKKIEDNIVDIVTALSFMLSNLEDFVKFRSSAMTCIGPLSQLPDSHGKNHDLLQSAFEQKRTDLRLLYDQAQVLHLKVQSISNLVSNILDLNNGNALKMLAIETRTENANISALTTKSVRDAAMVKVLTIVTLVYLPLTVVTNFFSTSFVNTTIGANGASRIAITGDLWILFAAGIPLTLITVYIWWIFAQKEIEGNYPRPWDSVAQHGRAMFINIQGQSPVKRVPNQDHYGENRS